MPPQKVNDAQLIARLAEVFRTHGYEGASLSIISQRTGLQRASLYHRFPEGKQQMAEAVLDWVDEQFVGHVLSPLSEPGERSRRVAETARRMNAFFDGGRNSCLLDVLSLGAATESLRAHVQRTFDAWHQAMASVAAESGLPRAAARRAASDALVRIQGALVVARAGGNDKPFKRTLKSLPAILAGGA
jgi:AcrR family transcriptional regulator